MMCARRMGSLLLAAVAIFTVLSHICALPFHAHAGAITTHEEPASHHAGDNPEEDTAHAASCEVVKSAPAAPDGVVLVPLGTIPAVTWESTRRLANVDAAVALGSPPLFLLHAALL